MKKILVIEDNREVRENLCEILELTDYDVVCAVNGKEGVEVVKEKHPDLIICDVMMPQLDGYGVLKILNNDPETFDIPFIFLTAKVEQSDLRKGMGLGADDYITKPFDHTELLEAVEMRLEKSERMRKAIQDSSADQQQLFSESRAWEQLKALSEKAELRSFAKKDCIYREGEYPNYLFYVEKGKVKLSKTNEMGKELIIRIYDQDEIFGYNALLRKKAYEESAFALEDSSIRLIPSKNFEELLMNDREFMAFLIQVIAKEASESEKHLIDLAYSSVRKKAANALLYFIPEHESDRKQVSITAPRDDLAAIAGTAKETLIRTLSDFKSEGLIKINGSNITILNVEELSEIPQ